jgi:2-polyprenyl-3-methyl-5-hydroxy-6-metoxy-1,4-benzoquinol methylase
MEFVKCNLCGSDQNQLFFEIADYWLERENIKATFVQCEQCGLVFQNPQPDAQEIAAHYPAEYEVYSDRPNEKRRLKVNFGLNRRRKFVLDYKQNGRLLDVGCASGSFLLWMKEKGDWKLNGVEFNGKAAQTARDKGLNVFTGSLEEAQFPQAYFDVITLWDVLEHLGDPSAALGEIFRILHSEGILILRLPNLESIDARIFGKYWAGFDSPRHLFVFNIKTIQGMLVKKGFSVIKMNTQVGGYLNFMKSVRFYWVAKKISPRIRKGILKILTSYPIRILMFPFFQWKDLNLRGSEVIIVAKKK